MNPKSIFLSKTFWLNLAFLIITLVQILGGAPWFDPMYQAAILAVANAIVRFFTDQPVTISLPTKQNITANVLVLLLLGSLGLTACGLGYGKYDTQALQAQIAKQDSALKYLQSSETALQAAAVKAQKVAPEIATQVGPTLLQLHSAVGSYQQAMSSPSDPSRSDQAWATARTLVTAAVEYLGPIALKALIAGAL